MVCLIKGFAMKCSLLLILLLALPSQAAWYQAKGSAAIINGDDAYAREQATRDALRQALLDSGASVSSLQQLENGSVTQDRFQIRSGGEIHQYQLLREEVRNNRLYITLRADIRAERQLCPSQRYAKDLTLVRLRLRNPEQTSYGGLDDLPPSVSRRLFEKIASHDQQFVARRWIDENLRIDPLYMQQGDRNDMEEIKALSQRTGSQYVVLGSIDDVSLEPQGNQLTSWLQDPLRHFTMQLYLFDGVNGALVSRHEYQGGALWSFGKRDRVGTTNSLFWESGYGQEVDHQLDRAVQDLAGELACAQVTARVIAQNERGPHINLGRRNGVKLGDQFRIQHRADFVDAFGDARSMRNPASGLFEVVQVLEDGAILRTQNRYEPLNIQIGDLAILE